ncbi:MAG: Omp28-related outer membrane protein [Bacteroidetes bacterium]|jgi:hypothetical protein|nr:Omp28-related outer membrane protein [Bacteroidota bacterium]
MNRLLIICAFITGTWLFTSCDKIEGPYRVENNSSIGTLPGTLTDIRVLNATTTSDDVANLKATFSITQSDPKTISVQFEWHGALSHPIEHTATGNDVTFNNDSISIAAPAPYGTLTFKYSATVSDNLVGEADFAVPFTPSSPIKKVLLEDYTGRLCGNCPKAQRLIADSLEPLYHEQLVVATNHAGHYAIPNPSNCFSEDFRNPASTELNSFFGLTAYPSSMINRVGYPTNHVKFFNSWQNVINQELGKPNNAYVGIYTSYDQSTRTANVVVSSEFLNTLSDDYKLVVYLLEDSIHACQLDYDLTTPSQIDSAYIHKHVVRGSINSTFGENLTSNPSTQTKFLRIYNYQIPSNFNDDQCYILAYVYKSSDYYVLQSEVKKIKH